MGEMSTETAFSISYLPVVVGAVVGSGFPTEPAVY